MSRLQNICYAILFATLAIYHKQIIGFLTLSRTSSLETYNHGSLDVCLQPDPLIPSNKRTEQYVKDKVESAAYQREIINKLSGIIQIPSESYDELGPIGQDERWNIFFQIEDYIKQTYPRVLSTVQLDHANTHGLILTWKGSLPPEEAKPILMLAHQDVVPVLADAVQDWTHPPYDGHFDGELIWGRGATDDKGYMISILESVDLLIKSGFEPKRTIILAFGCDEEITGENCGRPISDFLFERYGRDGIYIIMDEGSMGVQTEFNQSFAMVSVAEKGYLDATINVTAAGGHASNPPEHNAIGVMSEIVVELERQAFPANLTPRNPMFGFLECAVVHAPDSDLLRNVRGRLGDAALDKRGAQKALAALLRDMQYYFKTTQSVAKVNGGIKVNAIPELVTAMVNLRLAVESSVGHIKDHYEELIKPIAKKHGMAFQGFGDESSSSSVRKISLSTVEALEPAPVSPVASEAFEILSGTIRHTLKPLIEGQELIVTPYLMPANTDTKFFWALTKNIYRFTPINLVHNLNRAHTTNEFIKASEFVREPYFFATLILNADDAAGKK
ncbi:hypothetical protein NLG97_g8479 [Lecanicillium saksenae]|uniref:Uncharacterized protein n=1 Tax=Lecanicillium saksenae TaxID=468837 RepID=A0ACC1QKR2_9HYPO|nr:hypothetical protein NLG97_g8479 [Lecanicillium saksenae]